MVIVSLAFERNGKEVSLFVDKQKFDTSVHGQLECLDCHSGFDADNLPHKEGKNISAVDCSSCHDNDIFSKSIHGQKNIQCFSCHSKHEIKPAVSLKKVMKFVYLHKTSSVKNYSKSQITAVF